MLYNLVTIRKEALLNEVPLFVDDQNCPCIRELIISYSRLVLGRFGCPPDTGIVLIHLGPAQLKPQLQ